MNAKDNTLLQLVMKLAELEQTTGQPHTFKVRPNGTIMLLPDTTGGE